MRLFESKERLDISHERQDNLETIKCSETKTEIIPGASQSGEELLGNGASQRIFLKFIESSYLISDPNREGIQS